MISYTKGNIFESKSVALVNAVNTVGVMGKGLALQFKKQFPENYKFYKAQCESKEFVIGQILSFEESDKLIINFPTKEHWRNASQYDYIEKGLIVLKELIEEKKISSIAIPALGCGLGGLDWDVVKQMIENKLLGLTETKIEVYEPM